MAQINIIVHRLRQFNVAGMWLRQCYNVDFGLLTGNTSSNTYPCARWHQKYSDIPGLETRADSPSVTREFSFPTIIRNAAAKKLTTWYPRKEVTTTNQFTKSLWLLNSFCHGRIKRIIKLNPKLEIKVKILLLFNKLAEEYANLSTPIKFCNENHTYVVTL